MAKKDRYYKIVEALAGGPPQGSPVLGDKDGHIIPPTELLVFNKNADGMRKVDHYRIRFEIDDFSNSRLRFVPNKDDAMWAQKGAGNSSCPTTACHMPGVFWVDDNPHPGGKWIDVINMDMQKEEFWFTLNLVDKSNPTSTNYVPVDPGGGNENGGAAGSGYKFDMIEALALGAGAGILVFAGAGLLLT